MARLVPPEDRRCVECGKKLPQHASDCPLRAFERDHTFGSDYDDSDEEQS